jgi:hypothetical protein
MRSRSSELARSVGASDPEPIANKPVLIYDGARLSAQMDQNSAAVTTARLVARRVAESRIDVTGDVGPGAS